MERLFDAGRWQEGLLPQIGISDEDRRQYDEFFSAWNRSVGCAERMAGRPLPFRSI